MSTLVAHEQAKLAALEQVIERGLSSFVEVGEALIEVRERRLYRAHGTFEDYCRERWKFTRKRGYDLIAAAEVSRALSPMGDTLATERQARELAPLRDQPERMSEAWQTATEAASLAGTPVTAEQVREAVGHVRGTNGHAPAPAAPTAPVIRSTTPNWSADERDRQQLVEAGDTVVANLRHDLALVAWAKAEGVFERIDRASVFGNPFVLNQDGDRDQVIAAYRDYYLPHKPSIIARLPDLNGRVLGCWCYPERCHGDVLVEAM